MSLTPTRPTLFTTITSIERDLRRIVSRHLKWEESAKELLGEDVFQKAMGRYETEEADIEGSPELVTILNYTDLPDLLHTINRHRDRLPDDLSHFFRRNTDRFERVFGVRNRVMHVRPLEYGDLPHVMDLARDAVQDEPEAFYWTEALLDQLNRDPASVLIYDFPSEPSPSVPHNLPIPDYDETGFIGRGEDLQKVKDACQGPYPVVSVLGEGGVGKTALAQHVAYDIAFSDREPFDSIAWVSAKTQTLSGSGIRRIHGAIQDSVGLLDEISDFLSGQQDRGPVEDILWWMDNFSILLVLDNLETVLDDNLQDFLTRLPAGSKVLITSRVGIGAYDFPIKLDPMDRKTSVRLLRAAASARGLDDLTSTSNEALGAYCKRMHFNPAYIKWFVSAVQAGRPPEEILSNPKPFLDFCMSNVYESLSEQAQDLLAALVTVPGFRTAGQLAHLCSASAIEAKRALQELMNANMLERRSSLAGRSYETSYQLTELAREYLKRHHPVEEQRIKELRKKQNQIKSAREVIAAERKLDPYSPGSISPPDKGGFVVAKLLYDAMRRIRSSKYDDADNLIDEAEALAPDFPEVHRVRAWKCVQIENYVAAKDAYDRALEADPDSAKLNYFFGGFLLRYWEDADQAEEYLTKAYKRDPESFRIKRELARACLYIHKFDRARELLDDLLERTDVTFRDQTIAQDLNIQYYHRRSDYELNIAHNPGSALELLSGLKTAYEQCPSDLRDETLRRHVGKALKTAHGCSHFLSDRSEVEVAKHLADWISRVSEFTDRTDVAEVGERLNGRVFNLPPTEYFGFIRGEDSRVYFFHRSNLQDNEYWDRLFVGDRVRFTVDEGEEGYIARSVSPEVPAGEDRLRKLIGSAMLGIILHIPEEQEYGFIRALEGPVLFFHKNHLVQERDWGILEPGVQVAFEISPGSSGPRAGKVRAREEG